MRKNLEDYDLPRSKWIEIFNEWILDEKARYIMERKLLDNVTFEDLADEVELSERQVKNIVYKNITKLEKHI